MDRRYADLRHPLFQPQQPSNSTSLATTIAAGIALLYFLHQVLLYFDCPVLSPQELVWNAVVFIIPKHLLLDRARRQELEATGILSQTHAAKSEGLRRMLGIGGTAILQKLPAEGFIRRASSITARLQPAIAQSDAPAGLGNWDNSCYQNSVLQGLASLDNLKPFLRQSEDGRGLARDTTTESLLETVMKLNDAGNNGKHIWTPARLKSMSSWQQQDAQEYFSKIMDELEKDAAKLAKEALVTPGLETIVQPCALNADFGTSGDAADDDEPTKTGCCNPLEGLLAQRVACTRCGYSEGLSMIPFNCLTVPLGSEHAYSLGDCLDEYTKIDKIPDVECAKCTLLRAEKQLENMLPSPPTSRSDDTEGIVTSKTLALPPELRAQAFQRLSAIKTALEKDDFADKTLNETCSIPKRARISSTKTRQAVIGRAPKSLAVHVNRSIFDELTGSQRKNYAAVRFPAKFDLRPWVVKIEKDDKGGTDSEVGGSMLCKPALSRLGEQWARDAMVYRIKAVVTHYGRHENGHYICYRQHPIRPRADEEAVDIEAAEPEDDEPRSTETFPDETAKEELRWWRLSDDDVSPVSEDEVLAQNGVFMLFYEREENSPQQPLPHIDITVADTAAVPPIAEALAVSETAEEQGTILAHIVSNQHSETATAPAPVLGDFSPVTSTLSRLSSSSATSDTSDTTDRVTETPDSPITQASTAPTIEDEFEVDGEQDKKSPSQSTNPPAKSSPKAASTPAMMRTAAEKPKQGHGRGRGFGKGGFRAMAAT